MNGGFARILLEEVAIRVSCFFKFFLEGKCIYYDTEVQN